MAPTDPDGLLAHVEVLVAIGELATAEVLVTERLDDAPEDLEALSVFAKIKHIRGELSAAIACWTHLHARLGAAGSARMHLVSMLNLAQDPERGAGEFVAMGQYRLVKKPVAYLELEQAFRAFTSRRPRAAREHCRAVANKNRARDRELFVLAVLAEAWIAELSGELEDARATLEQLGEERGFETNIDRVMALVAVYEQLGTPTALSAAVNTCHFLERADAQQPIMGRLAQLYSRLGDEERAQHYAARHEIEFYRRVHMPTRAVAVRAAARRYLPLGRLGVVDWPMAGPLEPETARERAVAATLDGDLAAARVTLADGAEPLDRLYRADIAALEGDGAGAVAGYLEALADAPDGTSEGSAEGGTDELLLIGALFDDAGHGQARQVAAWLRTNKHAARLMAALEAAAQADPRNPRPWRRLTRLHELTGAPEEQRRAAERAEVLGRALELERGPVGRVLSAAVYHFAGHAVGVIHEVWASREPTAPGRGGALPRGHILGNVDEPMRQNIRNTFMSVREYARTRFPDQTQQLFDYHYTFKVTKEDEPSGGLSAGLPTALVLLSVFLQRPVAQDLAFSGIVVADAHDVLTVHAIGEAEYKVEGAYMRDLRALVLPAENEAELWRSAVVPMDAVTRRVRFVSNLDEAARLAFGGDVAL